MVCLVYTTKINIENHFVAAIILDIIIYNAAAATVIFCSAVDSFRYHQRTICRFVMTMVPRYNISLTNIDLRRMRVFLVYFRASNRIYLLPPQMVAGHTIINS